MFALFMGFVLALAFAALHKILRRGAGKDTWCD